MEIVMKKTDDLIPYERNQKDHNEQQIRNVVNSIRRFGWKQPIVIDKKSVIIIGHCRYLAAKEMGLDEVPVVVASDLTEDEVRELRIADNKTNESEWNSFLGEDVKELKFDGFEFAFDLPDELDWATVPELTDKTYKETEDTLLECPFCHRTDRKAHFKQVIGAPITPDDFEIEEDDEFEETDGEDE